MQALAIGHTLEDDLSPYGDHELGGFFLENLGRKSVIIQGDIVIATHRLETLDKFVRTLVVLHMFQHEHD